MSDKPVAAGKSSFDLIDPERLFALLELKPGMQLLDLACGSGRYALQLAARVGPSGHIYAIDLWQEGLELLESEASSKELEQIVTLHADIRSPLPLDNGSVDACLLATILHDLAPKEQQQVIAEAARLLKPGGTLNIIEFKKLDHGPGPRIAIRLDEQQLEALAAPCGFERVAGEELGEFTYMVKYRKSG